MKLVLGLAMVVALLATMLGTVKAEAQPAPASLSLNYDGDLYLKVLDLHLDQRIAPDGYESSVALRAYGILAAFKKFDIRAAAHGRIDGRTLRPGAFVYDNQDGERLRKVQVNWKPGEVVATSKPSFGNMGSPPATPAQKLAAADPLTQVLRITLAAQQAQICSGSPQFFDGKQLYALDFAPGREVPIDAGQHALGLTSAVRCDVTYREVAGFKPKTAKNRGDQLKSGIHVVFGQLGAGGPWVIARITADTRFGPAVIVLRSVQTNPATSPTAG
jgi:hypothetical protein